jgi:ferredoxin-NADP reductase
MLRHALETQPGVRLGLVYSARAPEDFAYLSEFQELESAGRILFRQTVTRNQSGDWAGRLGRIDAEYLSPMIEPSSTLCFICGPPALLAEMPAVLQQLGVDASQILMEQWP